MEWKNIILDLISEGLTQAQIAKEAGVAQSTIAGLLAGHQRDMRWGNGNRLLALHARLLSLKKTLSTPTPSPTISNAEAPHA